MSTKKTTTKITPQEIRAAWRRGHKGSIWIGRYEDGSWYVVSSSAWPYRVHVNEFGSIDFKMGHKEGAVISEKARPRRRRDPSRRMTDGAVLNAFLDKRAAESKKLSTDGHRLNGNWMGGSTIAEWKHGKIVFHDLGSKAAQRVRKALVVGTPKNWIAAESAWALGGRRRDPKDPGFRRPTHSNGRELDAAQKRFLNYVFAALRRFGESKEEASGLIYDHLSTLVVAEDRGENPDTVADRIWKYGGQHRKGRDPKHDTADLIRFIWRQVPSDYRTTSMDGKPGKWIMTGESYWRHGGARILDLETMPRSEILDFARKHFGYKG